MGRCHRQAARFAIRTPPLAAMAEDEMRGLPGVRHRRIYRSAGRPRWPWRAPRWLFRGRRFCFRRKSRHRLRYQAACSTCAHNSMHSRSSRRRSPGPSGLPRLRAHWVRPEIVVQVAFIEWTVHGKLRHSRFLGVRTDKSAHDVVRETRADRDQDIRSNLFLRNRRMIC